MGPLFYAKFSPDRGLGMVQETTNLKIQQKLLFWRFCGGLIIQIKLKLQLLSDVHGF